MRVLMIPVSKESGSGGVIKDQDFENSALVRVWVKEKKFLPYSSLDIPYHFYDLCSEQHRINPLTLSH